MDESIRLIMSSLNVNPGASDTALEALRRSYPMLPVAYLSFLAHSNGAEGQIGEHNYLILWAAEVMPECNSGYGVDDFAPGLLLFGTDGWNSGYGFDCRFKDSPVVEVSLTGLEWSDAEVIAPDFGGFLQRLSSADAPDQ